MLLQYLIQIVKLPFNSFFAQISTSRGLQELHSFPAESYLQLSACAKPRASWHKEELPSPTQPSMNYRQPTRSSGSPLGYGWVEKG